MSKEIIWRVIRNQSLARAARESGYDLTMYEEYPVAVRDTLKVHAIRNVLSNLREDFEYQYNPESFNIKQGVYVICLSDPFTVSYGKFTSNVIYIGRGNIAGRLKSHFDNSLFDVMMSLAGTNFDFYLSNPSDADGDGYYKQLEHDLLQNFSDKIGNGNFPLLNKNAGWEQNLRLGAGWNFPLKGAGKRPTWAIKPTGKRPIRRLS